MPRQLKKELLYQEFREPKQEAYIGDSQYYSGSICAIGSACVSSHCRVVKNIYQYCYRLSFVS